MVPQFVSKIGCVAEQGLQVAHYGNYGSRLTIAFFAIFDCHQLIHHLVNVATILREIESATSVVVIFSHKNYSILPPLPE